MIIALSIIYVMALGFIFTSLINLSDSIRIAISIMLIAPLGFFMGVPFPLALANLGRYAPTLMPWAWGINGCASVLSAVLATLIAIHFGFTVLIMLALVLYGVALF